MITVFDQYEIEYKETYVSGTYDQVVMGKMFYGVKEKGITKYVYGNRGVVYGSINSDQIKISGDNLLDRSDSVSYRSQPYREKAGNCRAAKHMCFGERIYDTLSPNPISCFKRNGANLFSPISDPLNAFPGMSGPYTGVDNVNPAFIMFDCYIPDENNNQRKNLNPIVDKHWTKSFPFEPRYSELQRQSKQTFSNVNSAYTACMVSKISLGYAPSLTGSLNFLQKSGLIMGTFGPERVSKNNLEFRGYSKTTASGSYFHRWAVDISTKRTFSDGGGLYSMYGGPPPNPVPNPVYYSYTGSCVDQDITKILFGFGDANTIVYSNQYKNSKDPTGYARFGTNNWPEFRINNHTSVVSGSLEYLGFEYDFSNTYEWFTGSMWSISPIIRGWKYGLYNALPDYTAAYYRQGRYGQFRDMLEQRLYTATFSEDSSELGNSVVTVKFFDQNENLVDPITTQSQNLSQFATSSLPYFDLIQRNRPVGIGINNLSLMNISIDKNNNLII